MERGGQKRASLSAERAGTRAGAGGWTWPGSLLSGGRPGDVRLRYLGACGLTIRSAATGRTYVWSGTGASLAVDSRDVVPLRRTGLFHRG